MYFYEDMDFDDYDSNSDSDSSSIVSVSTLDSSSSSGFFGSDEIESDVDLELALEELGQPQSEDEMTSENESDDGDSTNSESEAYEGDEDLHFLDDDSDDSLSAASNYEEGILPPFNLTGTICYCSSSSVAFRKEQLIIPQFIEDLTERKKWNIFVIGNVGAGKTTFIDKLCDLLEGHCTKRTEMTKYLPVYLNNDPQVYFYIKLALQELLIQHTTNSNAKFRVFENTLEMPLYVYFLLCMFIFLIFVFAETFSRIEFLERQTRTNSITLIF